MDLSGITNCTFQCLGQTNKTHICTEILAISDLPGHSHSEDPSHFPPSVFISTFPLRAAFPRLEQFCQYVILLIGSMHTSERHLYLLFEKLPVESENRSVSRLHAAAYCRAGEFFYGARSAQTFKKMKVISMMSYNVLQHCDCA